ncbi:MAG: hypothetical protein Q8Q59_00925 [Luteolibacter sp.]|jgi:hypothetical protein|nr:hypothetical protein [Luteolibacter sp.]
MIQEIGEPIREIDGALKHPVKTFKTLAEHAFGAVAMRLEFDSGLILQLAPPLIIEDHADRQNQYQEAGQAGFEADQGVP